MIFGLQEVGIAVGAIITTWIVQNTELKDGLTEWFIDKIGSDRFDADMHSVLETIKGLQYESQLEDFDNKLKEDLYKWYINATLQCYSEFINEYIILSKNTKLDELKKQTKLLLYKKLSEVRNTTETTIKMPDPLQGKFDSFRNYLDKQMLAILEKSLVANTKSLLNIQLLDALETNIRWMVFYTTSMFENFNGRFDNLTKRDIFIRDRIN